VISNRFLPSFLKEVLTHIPTLALKSVDWKGILKELGPVLLRLGKDNLEKEKIEILKSNLHSEINFTEHNGTIDNQEEFSFTLLKLYFDQLQSPEGFVLDLRAKFFKFEEQKLSWNPSNIWYQLDENFRVSLLNIYKGFYFEDDEMFRQALVEIGLGRDLEKDKLDELEELFKKHFGTGGSEPIYFKLGEFQDSFYHLFKFFVDNKVALSKDFLFLGIYLVTLYMSLEASGCKLDVKKAFLEVYPKES